jgi:hypothetical protein
MNFRFGLDPCKIICGAKGPGVPLELRAALATTNEKGTGVAQIVGQL